jgi:adenylate cyclase
MAQTHVQRRLSAILAADVVGYSRLIGDDEEGTIARLRALRTEAIDPSVEEFGGRIVKTMGDGLLVEFASVVDAVRAAVEIQREIAERNAGGAEDQRIELRIGINLGDIVIDGDDILGDGVNVAARLENMATPGGICISDRVFAYVRGKVDVGFEDLGEQGLKNIAEPVRVYRISLDPDSAGIASVRPKKSTNARISAAAILVLILISAGSGYWWWSSISRVNPADVEQLVSSKPDKASIAVLPFSNFSGNKQDHFIAKGLTEDLITTLSKVPQLSVISRTSSSAFKNKNVTTAEIAEQLGVRYLVEGSIQRSGEKLRINAQLIDAVRDHHLWAENFDGKANDLFSFQDDIVRRILVELQVKLTSGEHARFASRGTSSLEAWLSWVRGFDEVFKLTREGMVRGRELFQVAHELDRKWARPLVGLSWTYWYGARRGWTDKRQEWIRKGIELAEKAVSLAPNEPGGYQMLGFLAQLQGDHDRAIALREKAFELAPGDFFVVFGLASVLYKAGQPKRALNYFKKARRLSPLMPPTLLGAIAEAQLLAGANEEAIATSKEMIKLQPNVAFPHIILAAVHSALGRLEEARSEAAEVLRLAPGFTVSAWLKTRVYKEEVTTKRVAGLLVSAGLPE